MASRSKPSEDAEKRPGSVTDHSVEEGSSHNDSMVEFGPDDRSNPMNWPQSRKNLEVIGIYLTTLVVSLSATIFTGAIVPTSIQFHVSEEVMTLAISLYVLGYAAGPLLWAPLSEAYGRRWPYLVSFFIFTIFHIPVAVAKNAATVLICRFIIGAAGSSTFASPPAMSVDFLEPVARGKALGLYMGIVFIGNFLGPIIGAYTVANPRLGWTWTAWLILIVSGALCIYIWFFIPESYAEVLLQRKARQLRVEGRDVQSKRDLQPIKWKSLLNIYMTRPAKMFFQEPILIAITVYNGLVYGILYLAFFAYPYCFGEVRGWSFTHATLPFLALPVGVIFALVGLSAFTQRWWLPRFVARGLKLHPEDRLPPMAASGILMTIGLFWFAWTSNPGIHWAPQVISGALLGAGVMLNFATCVSYIVDVYLINANSAMAANVCVRSLAGAAFPLFAHAMYRRLGPAWATSLLAFLCLAMVPIPFLFMRYGKALRGMSKFAFD